MRCALDLAGYCARIGYTGARSPTLDVLHALTQAHAQAIPFENLDVLLDRPIELDPATLYQQLVTHRRGGYCFQQNGLLLEVLRQIGFSVRPLRAAVRIGLPDRAADAGHTHLALEVTIDGAAWLTDVGVGAASQTCALRLAPDIEQATPHETRRFQRADGKWYSQILRGGEWTDVYEFDGGTMRLRDRSIANWYTSTHPESKFRRDLFAARALPQGRRITLFNRTLTLRDADGSAEQRELGNVAELGRALREHFGIELVRPALDALDGHLQHAA